MSALPVQDFRKPEAQLELRVPPKHRSCYIQGLQHMQKGLFFLQYTPGTPLIKFLKISVHKQ